MNLRHVNRGDVKAGRCPFCQPRHKRFEAEIPTDYLYKEGLVELDEVLGDDPESGFDHEHPLTWFPRCG